jgi:hypothetical protein
MRLALQSGILLKRIVGHHLVAERLDRHSCGALFGGFYARPLRRLPDSREQEGPLSKTSCRCPLYPRKRTSLARFSVGRARALVTGGSRWFSSLRAPPKPQPGDLVTHRAEAKRIVDEHLMSRGITSRVANERTVTRSKAEFSVTEV